MIVGNMGQLHAVPQIPALPKSGFGECDRCHRIIWLVKVVAQFKGFLYGECEKCHDRP